MKIAVLTLLIVSFTFTAVTAQQDLRTVELFSSADLMPKPVKGQKLVIPASTYNKSRFDLVTLEQGCTTYLCIVYGSRFGNNWDIFTVGGGAVSETRMIRLGKFGWSDKFTVPDLQPWPKLAPGERRHVTVDVSGGDGYDGAPGRNGSGPLGEMNGDGSFTHQREAKNEDKGSASLSRQTGTVVRTADGKTRNDNYSPFVEVKEGHMYLVRVKDDTRDQLVLIRVDALKRGKTATISYRLVPKRKSIF